MFSALFGGISSLFQGINATDALAAGTSVLTNYMQSKTAAQAVYQRDYAQYRADVQRLEIQKQQYLQEAAAKGAENILQQMNLTNAQMEIDAAARNKIDDLNLAARSARATVEAEAAQGNVVGNSVNLAARAVLGQAAEAVGDVKFNANSELATLQMKKIASAYSAQMQPFLYYDPVAPSEDSYYTNLFSNTLTDISNKLTSIYKPQISKETQVSVGLAKG